MTTKRTRNGDATETTDPGTLQVIGEAASELAASYIQPIDKSWLEGVTVERIVPLPDGAGIRGRFLGKGGPVEVSDPVTGEVRPLDTWRFEVAPGIVVRLLDSARLKSDLATFATDGTVRLRVMRLGSVDTKRGRRVTDYIVAKENG